MDLCILISISQFTCLLYFTSIDVALGCISIGFVFFVHRPRKFHGSTTTTLSHVLDQANTTSMKLRNVSSYLAAAKLIGVNQAVLPSNVQTDIDEIETKTYTSASFLNDKAMDNADNIRDSLDAVSYSLCQTRCYIMCIQEAIPLHLIQEVGYSLDIVTIKLA